MVNPQKILITGADGFIGQHLCRHFVRQNFNVIACSRRNFDLPDEKFKQLIAQEQPDYLLHCAGGASVGESLQHPEKDFTNSVVITEFILSALAQHSPKTKCLFFSSAAVYGNTSNQIIDEKTPLKPISPYGYHKLLCEMICDKFYHLYRLPITILRIFSVYGTGLKKQILWDIYQKSLQSNVIQLFGTGQESRDFLHIDDLVNNVARLLKTSSFDANKVNFATGTSITIKTLAEKFIAALDKPISLQFTGVTKIGDPNSWHIDPRLVAFPSTQWTSIDHGIKRYVEWLSRETMAL